MSRRKSRDSTYGEVVLECPHGHPLGAIVLTRHGDMHRLDRPLRDNAPSPSRPVVIGEKVKALCPTCHEAGRWADYQASWELVKSQLIAQRDTPSERRVLTLG